MIYTLKELADRVGGRVIGDGRVKITGVQPFQQAATGDLTLAAESRLFSRLETTEASAVIVPKGVTSTSHNLLQADQPKVVFAQLLGLFHHHPFQAMGISPLAQVSEKSRVADEVTIHPFVVVEEDVDIEKEVTLYPGVYIGSSCRTSSALMTVIDMLFPHLLRYAQIVLTE